MSDPQMPSPAESFDHTRQFVSCRAGDLAIEVMGDGRPLVLLHPLALAGRVWGPFADRLAETFRVIKVDVRGHGESTWDGKPFPIADLAADVTAVLDALGIESAHLLGLSMGGSIAVAVAGLHPQRVDRMFLADTTAWYGDDAVAAWTQRADRALNVPRERQVEFQIDRWFTGAFREGHPEEVCRVVDVFLATDSRVHAAAARAMGQMDSRDLLPAVTAPTLVVTGVEDYATPPEMGRLIAERVREGRSITLPGLRHLSLIERPELADLVIEHLEEKA
jgi:3-oxoadipate enol-lactonase